MNHINPLLTEMKTSGKKVFSRLGAKRAGLSITVNSSDLKDQTARADDRRRRAAFRLQKADTEARLELMTKKYKEATRELDETAFQLAITNEELKRKEKELEERLAEVMALRSLQRKQRDPQEK